MYGPKVSICIPTYKQVNYLRRTLESIQKQSYQDYEIIITDDSPDNQVKDLINEFSFEKLKYFKNTRQLGSPENWNESVHKANGQYIKILHHDDWFTFSDSLEEYVRLLDHNSDVDFAFSAAVAQNVEENRSWFHSATPVQLEKLKDSPHELFFGNFIGPPSSTIYRRSSNLHYDKKLKWVVDIEFYIRYLLQNRKFAFSPRELITSISGAKHNVTNECINNKEIEIFEYLYLYNKIIKNKVRVPKKYYNFFVALFDRYSISSFKDISDCGMHNLIPLPLYLLILKRKLQKQT